MTECPEYQNSWKEKHGSDHVLPCIVVLETQKHTYLVLLCNSSLNDSLKKAIFQKTYLKN